MMAMKKTVAFICFFWSCTAFAQNYNVALISDSLKQGANAVKRAEELRVIIKSPSKAVIRHTYAITILNEEGAAQAEYENSYNKMLSLENISGTLYDASGKEIKTVKKKDIGDFSAHADGTLISDERLKRFNFYCTQYPYTVVFEDEQDMDGIFFLPSWKPIEETKFSVEQSSFIVEMPADFALRYKEIAYAGAPVIDNSGGKKTYSWQVKNLAAVTSEDFQPLWSEINPAVYIAPSQFEIGNYKGDMSSWLGLGQFIRSLNTDRQQLPDNVKADVHRLADPLADTTEKIKALYNYMQKNTRYISIQLGMGGWQPFDASYVAAKKYGDCKALSNYMVSLLKEAGVSSNYVLITAGENRSGLWEDFPAPYFNHAVICVPRGKDTTWLECTNQNISAGYMGSFTCNRKALLIGADGGHVVNTPSYPAADNLQLRKTNAEIDANGTLFAQVLTHFTGLQQDFVSSLMHEADARQKERYLNSTLNLPTYTVEKYEYTETKDLIPSVDERLSVTSPNYANITGKRLFITPNIFNRSHEKLPEDDKRKYDLRFFESYIDVDTIHIRIPADYTVEAMPKAVSLKTAYGEYSISFELTGNAIDVLRKNRMNEGRFPRSEYAAIAKYFNDIYKADRGRVVLVKKGD